MKEIDFPPEIKKIIGSFSGSFHKITPEHRDYFHFIFMAAIDKKSIPFVEYMIKHNHVNINKRIGGGGHLTPLLNAISTNDTKIVQLILSHPNINVNKGTPPHSQTEVCSWWQSVYPLAYAVSKGNLDIVKSLLQMPGIQINQTDEYGLSPLAMAIRSKHQEIIDLLLNTPGIDPYCHCLVSKPEENDIGGDWFKGKPIHYTSGADLDSAVCHNDVERVRQLIEDPNLDINYVSYIEAGMDRRFFANLHGSECVLIHAIMEKNEMIVQLLLSHPRIDVNNKFAYFLENQTWHEYVKIIPTGKTPLMYAVETGHEEIVTMLLGMPGIDVNMIEVGTRKTALLYACEMRHVNIVERLLAMPGINLTNFYFSKYVIFSSGGPEKNDKIFRMLLVHPECPTAIMKDALCVWAQGMLSDETIQPVLDRIKKENTLKWRTAVYKAMISVINPPLEDLHKERFEYLLKSQRMNYYTFMRLAIQAKSPAGVMFVLKFADITRLRHMRYSLPTQVGNSPRVVRKRRSWETGRLTYSDAMCLLNKRIVILQELRALTEIELFAKHLPYLPLDIQRYIGKMLALPLSSLVHGDIDVHQEEKDEEPEPEPEPEPEVIEPYPIPPRPEDDRDIYGYDEEEYEHEHEEEEEDEKVEDIHRFDEQEYEHEEEDEDNETEDDYSSDEEEYEEKQRCLLLQRLDEWIDPVTPTPHESEEEYDE